MSRRNYFIGLIAYAVFAIVVYGVIFPVVWPQPSTLGELVIYIAAPVVGAMNTFVLYVLRRPHVPNRRS